MNYAPNFPLENRRLSDVKPFIEPELFERRESLVKKDGFTADNYDYGAACVLNSEVEEQSKPE